MGEENYLYRVFVRTNELKGIKTSAQHLDHKFYNYNSITNSLTFNAWLKNHLLHEIAQDFSFSSASLY